jgi:hypothetical protein
MSVKSLSIAIFRSVCLSDVHFLYIGVIRMGVHYCIVGGPHRYCSAMSPSRLTGLDLNRGPTFGRQAR